MGKTSWQVKQKYNDKAYDKLYISVPKGQKEKIKEHAKKKGIDSINGYINDLIKEDMEKDR
jgi:hypothetical protein